MKKILLTLTVLAACLTGLAAQDQALTFDHRVPGDRALTIQLGPVFPLGFQTFDGAWSAPNLFPGGTLALDVDFYLNDTFRLGGGIKGKASFGVNGHTLFMVPLMFRATWELRTFPWSFPVGVAVGACFTSYNQHTTLDPFVMPTAGAYWNVNSSWSFGLDASYWLVAQPFFGPTPPASDSRLGHFVDLTLGAVYHF